MMRTIWNVVSFLATVHLLALAGVAVWLWKDDRISAQRLHHVREIFASTNAEERASGEEMEKQKQVAIQDQIDHARSENPPADSQTQISHASILQVQQEQALRQLEQERSRLLQQLMDVTTQLKQQRTQIEQEKADLANASDSETQRKNDEQFQRIVRQYEQLPPKQGKRMLMELVDQNQKDQAVAYLVGMSPRASAKILKEFKTDEEIQLATELLERMRTHGTNKPAAQDVANASNPSNNFR